MAKKPTHEEFEQKIKALEDEADASRRAEVALREHEQVLKVFVAHTPAAVAMCDREMRYILYSRRWASDYGLGEEDLIGRCHYDVFPDLPEHWKQEHQKCLAGEIVKRHEEPFPRADGSIDWVKRELCPWRDDADKIGGLIMFTEVITTRKEAEEALRESENRLKGIFESIPSPIIVYNTEGHPLYLNPAFTELFLWSLDELKGRRIPFVPDDQKGLSAKKIGEVYSTGEVVSYETKRLTKQGDVIDVIISGAFLTGPDGDPMEMVAILTDITSLKQAEESLRVSEKKYRTILESIEDGYFEVDILGNLTFFNNSLCEILGYSRDELMGMNNRQFTDEENAKEVYQTFNTVYTTGKPDKGFDWELIRKDGSKRYVEASVSLRKDSEGKPIGFRGVARDVGERRQAEEDKAILEAKLQQAQKMESIGTLAGGIAHDFNNLLMAIQGRASIMLMNKDSSHPDFGHLRGIEGHVESAADLTRQLLGFARGGKYEVRPTDLNELVKKQNRMFGRTKKEIVINGKYEENLWSAEVDRGQIEQVLLNLYVNAWQAMPGGGNLYVETENVALDENYIKPFAIEPGRYVKISVTDTGVGMDKATQEKIFDPFFTTKEMGRGTGLGLASAYGIIKNHGGFINVYSEEGHGATFNVYLPATGADSMAQIAESREEDEIIRGKETILFVDDENMIIEIAEELLDALGYKVLIARSGKEAIEIYQDNKQRIDLILLDMIMPDMSGSETYDRLQYIDPRVKVLLSSGYSINGQATEILDRGCNGFIQKPFKIKELSQKLREILEEE